MHTTLSIIIVNWNTQKLLLNCLASLYQDPFIDPLDIWVVDNASTDDSVNAIRKEFPQVNLIECSENKGFAAGNNLALKRTKSEYVLLLNPDTLAAPGAIRCLFDFMESQPGAGAAGPALINPDGTAQDSCFPFPSLSREFWRLLHLDTLYPYGIYDTKRWDHNQPRSVDVLQGACLMIRSKALEQVGLFDPNFFMYTEEVDLCYRLKKAGWSIFWIPAAQVIHYGGQSTRQAAPEMFISLYQTKVQFFRKHYGARSARHYKAILFFAASARILFSPLALLMKPPARARGLYLARRYIDLLARLPKM